MGQHIFSTCIDCIIMKSYDTAMWRYKFHWFEKDFIIFLCITAYNLRTITRSPIDQAIINTVFSKMFHRKWFSAISNQINLRKYYFQTGSLCGINNVNKKLHNMISENTKVELASSYLGYNYVPFYCGCTNNLNLMISKCIHYIINSNICIDVLNQSWYLNKVRTGRLNIYSRTIIGRTKIKILENLP